MIQVTLGACLRKLDAEEEGKPPALRRYVPTLTELARAIGVHRVTLTNLANNNIKLVNLEMLSAAMSELLGRGFEVRLTDLLAVYPADLVTSSGLTDQEIEVTLAPE